MSMTKCMTVLSSAKDEFLISTNFSQDPLSTSSFSVSFENLLCDSKDTFKLTSQAKNEFWYFFFRNFLILNFCQMLCWMEPRIPYFHWHEYTFLLGWNKNRWSANIVSQVKLQKMTKPQLRHSHREFWRRTRPPKCQVCYKTDVFWFRENSDTFRYSCVN